MSRRAAAGLLLIMIAGAAWASDRHSRLWGVSGEKWSPSSRLPDFSHAGYGRGERSIPEFPIRANVKNFGAVGDGVTDDTNAFLDALKAANAGTILIPAGRYVVSQQLKINRGGVVLRGEGRDKTVLIFSKSLADLLGANASWSWSGGLINFEGYDSGQSIAAVTSAAKRGDTTIELSSTAGLNVGQAVRLQMINVDGTLGKRLYADQIEASKDLKGLKLVDFPAKITAIQENRVTLDRPLRIDVALAWQPTLLTDEPTVEDVGIEDLTLQFPEMPYPGHHNEPGFNAVNFEGITNGWARRLRIVNADSGILLRNGTRFCTVDDVDFEAGRKRERTGYGGKGEPTTIVVTGHHGLLALGMAQDNLFTNFHFGVRYIHDLCVSAYSTGNVFSHGSGVDLSIDHHRRGPYENLFTDIDAGQGNRLWEAGGDLTDGPPGGARETYWSVRSMRPQDFPPWAVQMNVIGMSSYRAAALAETGNWWEAIAPNSLEPKDLYSAQIAAAQKKTHASPRP